MTPTKHEGLYYRKNKRNKKVFYARFKIDGKAYLKKLGVEPVMNTQLANVARLDMIAKMKGGYVANGKSLDLFFEEYLESRRASLSDSWYYNTEKNYRKHLHDLIGSRLPGEVVAMEAQRVINDMLTGANPAKKKYAPSTAKQIKDCVSGLYGYIKKTGVDVPNIGRDLVIPSFDNKIYFTISEVSAQKLFDVILGYNDLKWRAYFVWLLHGRRKMEAAEMRWEWIDFENNIYRIPGDSTKGKKEIVAPMTKLLKSMLDRIGMKESGFIFAGTGESGYISSTGIDFQWRNIRALSGVPKMRLHDIRHLIGFVAVNSGYSLEMIGSVLAHGSTATTKRYSNMKSQSAASVLGSMFDRYVK